MIYRFRLISDELDSFARSIEIHDMATFLELHNAIQDSVGYDKSQLASFYISDDGWERHEQITLLDMGGEDNTVMMGDAILKDYLSGLEEKLVYVFDFFSNRAFYVTLAEIKEPSENVEYPFLANAIGEPPAQFAFNADDLSEEIPSERDARFSGKHDDFDDFDDYGDDNFENLDDYADRY